jgi:hypothetical protein
MYPVGVWAMMSSKHATTCLGAVLGTSPSAVFRAPLPRLQLYRHRTLIARSKGALTGWMGSYSVPQCFCRIVFSLRHHPSPPHWLWGRAGKEWQEVNGYNGKPHSEHSNWQKTVAGSYLQQGMDDFCLALEEVLRDSNDADGDSDIPSDEAGIWRSIRQVSGPLGGQLLSCGRRLAALPPIKATACTEPSPLD